MSAEPLVITEINQGVALLTLNRPDARNAMNYDLAHATVEAVGKVQNERVIVVTGAGSAFCAGLDLANLGIDKITDMPPFTEVFRRSNIPVIAAVNGPAVTGGFEVALACDFMIASEQARFADTHMRVGVYPGPVLVDLPRRIGLAKAREMSMTGNFMHAQEALAFGLVNHVVPHEQLLPFSTKIAADIAEINPAMIRAMREDWNQTHHLPRDEAYQRHKEFMQAQGTFAASDQTLQQHQRDVINRAHKQ